MIGFTSLEKFILNLGYSLIKYCIEEVCLNIEMGETFRNSEEICLNSKVQTTYNITPMRLVNEECKFELVRYHIWRNKLQ